MAFFGWTAECFDVKFIEGRKQRKGGNIFQLPLQVVQVPEVITRVRVKHQQAGIFWVSHHAVMAIFLAVVGFLKD